jgi:multidrug efflux pump subunit AcrA (membrane-fusion protein)
MKRQVTIVLGVLVILAGVGVNKYLSSKAKPPKRNPQGGKPTVLVQKVQNGFVKNTIPVTGKLVAKNRVELFAEVQGSVLNSGKTFKEGVSFSNGSRMLKLDSTEFHLSLLSAKSNFLNSLIQLTPDIKYDFREELDRWNVFINSVNIEQPFPALPKSKNKKFLNFLISRSIPNQYYTIKSQEEKLSKFNLIAPFSGTLIEGNLQPGSMVRVGQKLGTFIQGGEYELEVSVSMNDGSLIKIGDSVLLQSEDIPGNWYGKVVRISVHIDQSTQTLKVYVNVSSKKLKEGMYLTGSIYSGGFENAVSIPRNILIGTNQVYLLKDTVLQLHEIKVLSIGENQAVIEGLSDGSKILGQVYSAAYNGMIVKPQLKN